MSKKNCIYVILNTGEYRKFDISDIPEENIWEEAEKKFGEGKVRQVGKLSPKFTKEDRKVLKEFHDAWKADH